jgi:hypothetical protein
MGQFPTDAPQSKQRFIRRKHPWRHLNAEELSDWQPYMRFFAEFIATFRSLSSNALIAILP